MPAMIFLKEIQEKEKEEHHSTTTTTTSILRGHFGSRLPTHKLRSVVKFLWIVGLGSRPVEGCTAPAMPYVAPALVVGFMAPAASHAAPSPVVELIAPSVSHVAAALVAEYITLAPSVHAAPAPAHEYISLAPAVYAAPAYVSPYAAPAPVVEGVAPIRLSLPDKGYMWRKTSGACCLRSASCWHGHCATV